MVVLNPETVVNYLEVKAATNYMYIRISVD